MPQEKRLFSPIEKEALGITELIRVGKLCFPSLRVGQMLMDAVPTGKDLYYVTDEELIRYLAEFLKNHAAEGDYPTAINAVKKPCVRRSGPM